MGRLFRHCVVNLTVHQVIDLDIEHGPIERRREPRIQGLPDGFHGALGRKGWLAGDLGRKFPCPRPQRFPRLHHLADQANSQGCRR